MSSDKFARLKLFSFITFFRQAVQGKQMDYTTGSIRKAVFMLAIPKILEMMMESVFAVVDIFFGKPGKDAVSVVGLTESVLTLVYSVAIGLSMAASAMVARRIGEKNPREAGKAGKQAVIHSLAVSLFMCISGLFIAGNILQSMGAPAGVLAIGVWVFAISYIICSVAKGSLKYNDHILYLTWLS